MKTKYEKWLGENLHLSSTLISVAGVFGSIARGSARPRDCDLVVVASHNPSTEEWDLLREQLNRLKLEFIHNFGIKLAVVMLSNAEWVSERDFFKNMRKVEFA